MKLKLILVILLILGLMFTVDSSLEAQAQYSVELQGITWDHSTLSVLIIPSQNESWWNPSYINATLRAVSEWNNAIIDFSYGYSNFSYLSKLRMVPTTNQALDSDFDIYITWIEEYSGIAVGTSRAVYTSPCFTINNTISLGTKTPGGYVLNEFDMQNVALHELGHSLGLGHSNYIGDIMYPNYTSRDTVNVLSTLDVYAASRVFEWMPKSTPLNPSNKCPQKSPVTLPSSISYRYLPISYKDLPPLPPSQTPSDYILRFILRPEFLIVLFVVVIALIFLAATRRRREEPQEIPTEGVLPQETVTSKINNQLCQHFP